MKQLLLIVFVAFNSAFGQSHDVFVVKAFIAGQRNYVVQSGFRVKGKKGIITALHGLTGTTLKFSARNELDEVYNDLEITELDIERDVAILSSSSYDKTNTGFDINTTKITDWQDVIIIGHPGGIYERKSLCRIGSPTNDILSRFMIADDSYKYFTKRKSPNVDKNVVSVQGNFVGGHSGSPLLSFQNKVIAVVNGGIMDSRPGISWAIPINEISWKPINATLLNQIRTLDPLKTNGPFIGQLISLNANNLDPKLQNEVKFRTQQFKKVLDNLEVSIAKADKERVEFKDSITGYTINEVLENSKILVVAFKLGGLTSPCLTNTSDGVGTVWIGSSGYGIRHLPNQSCYRYEQFKGDDLTTFELFKEDSIKVRFNEKVQTLDDLAGSYPSSHLQAANRWFKIWNTPDRDKIFQAKYNDFNLYVDLIKLWYVDIKSNYYNLTNYLTRYSGGGKEN